MSKDPITKYLGRTIDWNPATRKFELEPEEHFYAKQVADYLGEHTPQPLAQGERGPHDDYKWIAPDKTFVCKCGNHKLHRTFVPTSHEEVSRLQCYECGRQGPLGRSWKSTLEGWRATHTARRAMLTAKIDYS